jgi:pyruvate dehydrogenase E2 component (dihydrolipoamide acetyltransferase)
VGAVIFVVEEGNEGKDGNEGKKEQDVSPEGAADTSPGHEARESEEAAPDNSSPSPEGAAQELATPTLRRAIPQNAMAPPPPAKGPREGVPVPAAPSVRLFARELGVNIADVPGSGPGGRISDEDVKKYVKSVFTAGGPAATATVAVMGGVPRPALPDFSVWGEITRESMSKVRSRTAEHMETSGAIPTVTHHDKADVTRLEELRKSWAKKAERAGVKLTVTAIAMKVAAAALKKFPQFNASIDMTRGEIIFKKYVHLGVAVDTERGLLVPVVRDVDKKNILEISKDMQELAEKARGKNIKPDDMQGATFTVTNLGGIGGTSFTPIINSPEVAILGISRGAIEPVYIDGQFQPRLMLPLSLTYDHRIIDGADAARFVRWIAEALEEPLLMALES